MSKNPSVSVYDESKIKTLSSLEHIRCVRHGIGRLGDGTNPDDGIYILLKKLSIMLSMNS